jgi:hypothetical protein
LETGLPIIGAGPAASFFALVLMGAALSLIAGAGTSAITLVEAVCSIVLLLLGSEQLVSSSRLLRCPPLWNFNPEFSSPDALRITGQAATSLLSPFANVSRLIIAQNRCIRPALHPAVTGLLSPPCVTQPSKRDTYLTNRPALEVVFGADKTRPSNIIRLDRVVELTNIEHWLLNCTVNRRKFDE